MNDNLRDEFKQMGNVDTSTSLQVTKRKNVEKIKR